MNQNMESHLRGNGGTDFRNLHETHVELEYRVAEPEIPANSCIMGLPVAQINTNREISSGE